ncbi:hypothetical protein FRC07_007120 [Ceratobasidium sp. 392]|nr:hypothetical protein FRC07_007120 [Ceratobasidium sp. 392]
MFLTNAFVDSTRQYEQDLYYWLEGAKPCFLALLNVPPRSSAEETELKSGKATIGSQQKTYNNNFVQEALFLVAQLNRLEQYAAGILEQVLSGYPNDNPVASAVKVVDQFHACRRYALDTLQLVLESAMGMHPVNAKQAGYAGCEDSAADRQESGITTTAAEQSTKHGFKYGYRY